MTPDGYLVDETGAWIFNRTRQEKVITAEGKEKVAAEDIINLTEMQLEKLKYLIQPLGEVDTNFMQTSVMNWDKETILPLVYRYLDIWAIKEADIGILPAWEDMSGPQILAYYDEGKVDLLMQSAFGRIWELPFSQGDIPVYKNGKSVVWVGTDPDVCNLEIDEIYQKDRSLYVEGSAFNIYTDGTKISKGRFRVKLDENSSSVFGYTIISISRL